MWGEAVHLQMTSCRWRVGEETYAAKSKSELIKNSIFPDSQRTRQFLLCSEIEHTIFCPKNEKSKCQRTLGGGEGELLKGNFM